jgi:hypothetical protein
MVTIMTLYIVAFSCFSHRVSGVFAQAFIISSDFPTGFFEDYIHSTRCSSAQEAGTTAAISARHRPRPNCRNPRMYKRKEEMNNENTSSFDLSQLLSLV